MSRKRPWPSFSKSMLPPRTVVTYRSASPSLSMSANEAETPTLSGDRHAGRRGDVLEPAAAGVLPELVAANLVDEVDVGQAVAVDVRDRHAVAMIVVRRLVRLAGIVDDSVLEGDAALGQAVRELEIVEHGECGHGLDLRVPNRLEPRCVLQVGRNDTDGGGLSGGVRGSLSGGVRGSSSGGVRGCSSGGVRGCLSRDHGSRRPHEQRRHHRDDDEEQGPGDARVR